MQESGVDLEFDIFDVVDTVAEQQSEFYEIQSRTLDDVVLSTTDKTADEVLLDVLNKDNMASMSRTQQKLQLQREHLLKQEQKKKEHERQRQLQQSSEVTIPFTRPAETLPPHIPPTVLKFQTKLENPTKYYVYKTQERKLKEYIDQQSSSQAQGPFTDSPQPTLNAINNMAVMTYGAENYAVNPPGSPMSGASSTGTSEVDEILDDIISLEGEANMGQVGLEHNFDSFFSLPPPTTMPVASGGVVSEIYDVGNMQPSTATASDPMSSSCPPMIKQEPEDVETKFDPVLYMKDRQKKDNHNMIERRRRFNINDRIKELGTIIPKADSDIKQNKGTILKSTVDYIKYLQKEVNRGKVQQERHRKTDTLNSKLLLRIQELEMHCRAHSVPVTPLSNDTSTATLSSLLVAKNDDLSVNIKHEFSYDENNTPCFMDGFSELNTLADEDVQDLMES